MIIALHLFSVVEEPSLSRQDSLQCRTVQLLLKLI